MKSCRDHYLRLLTTALISLHEFLSNSCAVGPNTLSLKYGSYKALPAEPRLRSKVSPSIRKKPTLRAVQLYVAYHATSYFVIVLRPAERHPRIPGRAPSHGTGGNRQILLFSRINEATSCCHFPPASRSLSLSREMSGGA